ncbi:MAG: ester cyclase [Caldilineaceae bacterium]
MRNRWFFGRILTLALLFSLSMVGSIQPMRAATMQAAKSDEKPHLEQLVGAWNIDATVPTLPPVPALLVFTSDGIVMGARPPLPFETPAYGNWISTGPQTAAFTFMTLTGSEKGPFSAKSKITGTVNYDPATDSWQGPNHLDVFDPSGTLVFSATGELSGTRIAVEPMKAAPTKEEGSGDAEEKQEAANQAVIQGFYDEVINQRKFDRFPKFFAAKVDGHDLGPTFTDIMILFNGIPNLHVTVERWILKGDTVTSVATFTGTQDGEMMGVAPTHKKVTWTHIDVHRIQNGKIVEYWHNIPYSDILQQIGYKLAPPAK